MRQIKIQIQLQNIEEKEIKSSPNSGLISSNPASYDRNVLDENERQTLQIALSIGLGDPETRQKYYTDSKGDALTTFQKNLIMQVQRGLKDDGMYDGAIDGIFGEASTRGLKEMASQNELYQEAINLLDGFDLPIENSQDSDIQNRVTGPSLNSNKGKTL